MTLGRIALDVLDDAKGGVRWPPPRVRTALEPAICGAPVEIKPRSAVISKIDPRDITDVRIGIDYNVTVGQPPAHYDWEQVVSSNKKWNSDRRLTLVSTTGTLTNGGAGAPASAMDCSPRSPRNAEGTLCVPLGASLRRLQSAEENRDGP